MARWPTCVRSVCFGRVIPETVGVRGGERSRLGLLGPACGPWFAWFVATAAVAHPWVAVCCLTEHDLLGGWCFRRISPIATEAQGPDAKIHGIFASHGEPSRGLYVADLRFYTLGRPLFVQRAV